MIASPSGANRWGFGMLRRECLEEIEKLLDDLGGGPPNDMAVIVEKEALDQASGLVTVCLGWRIVLP